MIGIAGIPLTIAPHGRVTTGVHGLLYLPSGRGCRARRSARRLRAAGRSASGLAMGLAAGYVVTCLAWWAVVAAHVASRARVLPRVGGLTAGLLLVAGAAALRTPVVAAARVDARDRALCLVLRSCPLLMAVRTAISARPMPKAASLLPRLLHRRLRVAHGADLGAAAVRDAAAQSVSWPTTAALLLDLFPRARRRSRAPGPRPCADVDDALKTNAIATAFVLCGVVLRASPQRRSARRMAAAVWRSRSWFWRRAPKGLALIVRQLAAGQSLVGPARHQRGCGDRLVVRRAPDRWRAPDDVLYAAARDVVCAWTAGARWSPSGAGAALTPPAAVVAGLLLGLSTAFNPFLGRGILRGVRPAVFVDLV